MRFADLHCDTASLLSDGRSLFQNDGMLSIQKMLDGGVFCQFFAMYISMDKFASPTDGYEFIREMHRRLISELEINKEHIEVARTAGEIAALRENGRLSAVLCVEEGGVLDGRIERLTELYDMGVRLITLTWNFENSLAYPNSGNPELMKLGLKPFGLQVIERMESLGMIVDVSHLSDGGFWDVARHSKKPFVASHSNARELCAHQRNLTDEMLRELAKAGGVTGINFYHLFLGGDNTGSIEQMVAHIRHIHNVAGIDTIALGSDFDGITGPCGLSDCGKLPLLADALAKAGFSEGEIEKICWKNAMRVIDELL